ncbi:iron export ABC transporter permease subunit FetB [Ramlibacter sp.]|uniref:ABC transporter permease n=1 Tax=Ramlibacter sp. TaxID=1917967 RepID=UPI00260DE31A|nr:iron export ABC transporter permease subunit FetB [Ramlibacter sp.]MDB5956521.1 transporter permease [Ramlibacter sp.]
MHDSPGYAELLAAASLLVVNGILSLRFDMRVARPLLIAGLRAAVQLLLVGFLLKSVFALNSPVLVAGVLLVMLASAGWEAFSRQRSRFAGAWGYGIGIAAMAAGTFPVTALAIVALQPRPWFAAQFTIPMFGIVLGSAMSGVSISLNAFNTALVRERAAIEAQLTLGATRHQALAMVQRDALGGGLIPVLNQMSAAGIITLPGMMTGQVLSGIPPLEAAKYQVFVLFLLAGATGLGTLATVLAATYRATDERHRLRTDRLT